MVCIDTSRLKIGRPPDAGGLGRSGAGILIGRFRGPRESVACAGRQSLGQWEKDISACGEKSSPSPWSSPPGEEITFAALAVHRRASTSGDQGRRSIHRVRWLDCRSNGQRIPGLIACEVRARGEAQRSAGERPSICPRSVRPEHRCIECAGLSGLGISALPDPGPPGRAVTSQAFGPYIGLAVHRRTPFCQRMRFVHSELRGVVVQRGAWGKRAEFRRSPTKSRQMIFTAEARRPEGIRGGRRGHGADGGAW
jgi:hypothetical protein